MLKNAKQATNVKVVHLEPESQRMARARIARLPAAIHAVHEKGKHLLMERMKIFFDQADDSLFSLADKAGSNQEQNIYFDSMREVRVQRRGFEKRFNTAIDEAFACLASGDIHPPSATIDDTLNVDALSLVQNDELEEMVAMESCVSRANSEYGDLIQQLSLRLDSLVPVKVFQQNNPLGPDVLSGAFMEQARRLDIDLKAKLVLFKLYDRAVMQNLESMYKAVNQVMIDHNVLTSLSASATTGQSGRVRDQNRSAAASSQPGSNSQNDEVVAMLQGLLAEQQRGGAVQHTGIGDVIRLLSLAQQAPVPAGNGSGGLSALNLIQQLQKRSGVESEIGRTEQEVIKLVDMLFNFILEDSNLAIEMKELISRMQIPIVKLALLDKSFFAKGGHSARRLLNEIATAALGWQPQGRDVQTDPFYKKVNEVVSTLLTRFDTDVGIFTDLLADFSAFVTKDRRRAEILERRTLDAEDGKAKAEVARTTVGLEIEVRTVGQGLPDVVQKLISGPWSNVLFVSNLKNGVDSEEWQQLLQTLDDLIWSAKVPASSDERKRLIRLVPDLLQRLRSGLDSISFNPFEMSEIFKRLEDVHLACIRGEHLTKAPLKDESKDLPAEAAKPEGKMVQQETKVSVETGTVNVNTNSQTRPAMGDTGVYGAVIEPELDNLDLGNAGDILADMDAVLAALDEPDDLEPTVSSTVARKLEEEHPTSAAEPVAVDNKPSSEEVLPDDEPFMQQVSAFVQGAWFEMVGDDGQVTRCRLAAVIKPTGKYIFVNRNGMKVAEKPKQELAILLRQSRLRALDNSMLFDRALETVVSSLRKPPQ